MNDQIDDAMDRLLREDAPGAVADEGFSVGLVESLPLRRPRAKWPLAVGIMAGTLGYWFTMQSAKVALTGWQDWLLGNLTSSALVLLASVAGR